MILDFNNHAMKSMATSYFLLLSFSFDWRFVLSSSGESNEGCGLYLAESSIPNAGWGVFAGKDFLMGDRVEQPGIGIQFIDSDRLKNEPSLSSYLWRSSMVGGFREADSVSTFLPGIGSLANYFPGLSNAVEGGLILDEISEGSSTAYHNHSFIATKNIFKGQEIFVGGAQLEKDIKWSNYSSVKDMERAKELVNGLILFRRKHPQISEIEWIDILYRVKNEMIVEEDTLKRLIPSTLEDLLSFEERGHPFLHRSMDWIKKNGFCLDWIREGKSKIDGAGYGAIATRFLPTGSIISPIPLTVVKKKSMELAHRGPNNATSQLLINYCFGHSKTSEVSLCPLSQAALVNHKSKNPNAAIRWGNPSTNRYHSSVNLLTKGLTELKQIIQEFKNDINAPLLMELYALKDIKEGEEIFFDYTAEWQQAYSNRSTIYDDANSEDRVVEHQDLHHECRVEPFANEEKRGEVVVEDYNGRSYLGKDDIAFWKIFGKNQFASWYSCKLLGTKDNGKTFHAEIFSKTQTPKRIFRIVHNIPSNAIRVTEGTYQSAQHHPLSFRHFIPIPNSIYPARWRNDYKSSFDLHLGSQDLGLNPDISEKAISVLHEQKLRDIKCGAYFAPSNIPEAGFSQYTAVSYSSKGITIGSYTPTLVIPILFEKSRQWVINEYVWSGSSYNTQFETTGGISNEVLGASLANFHPGAVNMELKAPIFRPVLDSCIDPGAGASSDYFGCAFNSKHSIKAGEELFISYGDGWFESRQAFTGIALGANYEESNRILSSIWSLSESSMESGKVVDMLHFAKHSIVKDSRTHDALKHISSKDDLQHVISRNGVAQSTLKLRTIDWLEEHGQCMDHIYIKRSTIHQAGQGAFSRRNLSKGTTIISSPMIHVFNRESMNFNLSMLEEETTINPTMQLLNYQFSNPKSSVYLLPINQMLAINHNSDRFPSGDMPNAELRWAKWNKKSEYVIQRPLEDLRKEPYSTMVMDVVATRNISQDEEIFIDYGKEWEDAWIEHTRRWRSPCDSGRMSSLFIMKMNADKYNSEYHKWSNDHFCVCHKPKSFQFKLIYIMQNITSPTYTKEGHLVTNDFNGITSRDDGFRISDLSKYKHNKFPCKILDPDSTRKTFKVALFFSAQSAIEIHDALPESSLLFSPKPYKSDMHLPGSFRYEIKIPDEIFPHHWMDLYINLN